MRNIKSVISAPLKLQFYRAFFNIFLYINRPFSALSQYIFGLGQYPDTFVVRTPMGKFRLKVYSSHDTTTLIECFCKLDYPCNPDSRIIVDMGSNIGLSALYFLTRGASSYLYLYEPVPVNIERLRENLSVFSGRYFLNEVAVGLEEGEADFAVEPTGRYGGLGLGHADSIRVKVVDFIDEIEKIIERHDRIDILKLDIEGLETAFLEILPERLRDKINFIYAETFGNAPNYKAHILRQWGSVSQYTFRREHRDEHDI